MFIFVHPLVGQLYFLWNKLFSIEIEIESKQMINLINILFCQKFFESPKSKFPKISSDSFALRRSWRNNDTLVTLDQVNANQSLTDV